MKERIDDTNIPEHVAVIMDGNGRWAKSRGRERIFGHMNGVESVRETLKTAREIGVKYLTLYAFSTENWNRPKEEVDALMDLLVTTIMDEIDELDDKSVRLKAIGDLDNLPPKCCNALKDGMARTAENDDITLILALSYSSRWEMTNAIRAIAEKVASGELAADEIDSSIVSKHLSTHDIPDPSLLIRTSGEKRISNFLLWQIAYAELYFTEVLWPDFRKQHFYEAILSYQNRERRFGMVSEQITKN
ncbi:MAG: isoprenyl transferase [Flavobacteriales bacterium]|nr:isoprenyl transferase [Flavobacteriales bacterium]